MKPFPHNRLWTSSASSHLYGKVTSSKGKERKTSESDQAISTCRLPPMFTFVKKIWPSKDLWTSWKWETALWVSQGTYWQ